MGDTISGIQMSKLLPLPLCAMTISAGAGSLLNVCSEGE
jgi:hypothetical protein